MRKFAPWLGIAFLVLAGFYLSGLNIIGLMAGDGSAIGFRSSIPLEFDALSIHSPPIKGWNKGESKVPLQVIGTTSNTSSVGIARFSSNDNNPPLLRFGRSRGASIGDYTPVTNRDELGRITFEGSDGTSLVMGAMIEAQVDGTTGHYDMPGRLIFYTTPIGSNDPVDRWIIDSTGELKTAKDNSYDLGGMGTSRPRSIYAGTSIVSPRINMTALPSDPPDPPEGSSVMWQSKGTDAAHDGNIMIKITAGGVTKTITLVDFAAH